MILKILGIIIAVYTFIIIISKIKDYYSQKKRVDMSFREAVNLAELPVVTFFNGSQNRKLNFLLDTGSDLSHINKSILPYLEYVLVSKDSDTDIVSAGNTIYNYGYIDMGITYKNQKFTDIFCVSDLDDAFAAVKSDTGVQIHGILGSRFFVKYKYILDFENLIAYSKK